LKTQENREIRLAGVGLGILVGFDVELRFQHFFRQEGISSSGILVTIIVDLGRENSNVALLAWSVAAASPRSSSFFGSHFCSTQVDLGTHPILLWELQILKETRTLMSIAPVASSNTFTFVITFYRVLIRWYEEPVDIPAFIQWLD
jgi:hypothetical protein